MVVMPLPPIAPQVLIGDDGSVLRMHCREPQLWRILHVGPVLSRTAGRVDVTGALVTTEYLTSLVAAPAWWSPTSLRREFTA